MRKLRAWFIRFGNLFNRQRKDRELSEEIESHLQLHIEDNVQQGMTLDEARRQALIKLGGVEAAKEACRDQNGLPSLESLIQDIRHGFRMFRKSPGFTAVALLTLALGIGASTTVFTVVHKVILNPLPVPNAHRLIEINEVNLIQGETMRVSEPMFMELQSLTNLFSAVTAFALDQLEIEGHDFPERIVGTKATADFFKVFFTAPLLGRLFSEDETQAGKDRVVIISHGLWQRRFAADPGIIGKPLTAGRDSLIVIGVMPPHFDVPNASGLNEFWRPCEIKASVAELTRARRYRHWHVAAQLHDRGSQKHVQAVLDALSIRLAKEHPDTSGKWTIQARPLAHLFTSETLPRTLWSLAMAAFFVLLIGCANIANLLLARTQARQKEIAIRIAVGATWRRLVQQQLTESVLLSLCGGLLALFLVRLGLHLAGSLLPEDLPRIAKLELDWGVLALAFLISLITGSICALVPIWKLSRHDLNPGLKGENLNSLGLNEGVKIRQGLVISEIALALSLLAGAGLMVQSVIRLLRVDLGFDPSNLLYVGVSSDRHEDRTNRETIVADIGERLRTLPGVLGVGIFEIGGVATYRIGDGSKAVELRQSSVGVEREDYFAALKVPLLAGRLLDRRDTAPGQRTVVVNESLAQLCWPRENALGKMIRKDALDIAYEVVGVVKDVKDWRYNQITIATFYEPYQRFEPSYLAFMVRTASAPGEIIHSIRREINTSVPGAPALIHFVEKELFSSTRMHRAYLLLLGILSLIGLTLAAVGIYGILSYWVERRNKEIGIRMALGASAGNILGMVLGQGSRMIFAGAASGLLLAFWMTQFMKAVLFEVQSTDPATFIAVIVILGTVGFLACWLPARRAARVDPMTALRCE